MTAEAFIVEEYKKVKNKYDKLIEDYKELENRSDFLYSALKIIASHIKDDGERLMLYTHDDRERILMSIEEIKIWYPLLEIVKENEVKKQ